MKRFFLSLIYNFNQCKSNCDSNGQFCVRLRTDFWVFDGFNFLVISYLLTYLFLLCTHNRIMINDDYQVFYWNTVVFQFC